MCLAESLLESVSLGVEPGGLNTCGRELQGWSLRKESRERALALIPCLRMIQTPTAALPPLQRASAPPSHTLYEEHSPEASAPSAPTLRSQPLSLSPGLPFSPTNLLL